MNLFFKYSALAAAVSWALVLFLFPATSDKPETGTPVETSPELYALQSTKANFGMVKASFYETAEDKSRWKIISEFAELHRKEDYAFLTGVVAEFTSAKSGNVVKTTSQYGRTYMSRKEVDLNGDVHITSRSGYLFRMENLTYQGRTHLFVSQDVVRMEGPDPLRPKMRLRGTGLLGNIDTEHFLLRKNVHGERRLGGHGDVLRIDSAQGEFFTSEQRSIFSGNVKAMMPKMSVTCERLKLKLDGEAEDIEASGNVKVLTRNRTAYANSAALQVGGNQILLEGKARVDSKENQIRGKRILLFTDEDRIEVEEAEGSSS